MTLSIPFIRAKYCLNLPGKTGNDNDNDDDVFYVQVSNYSMIRYKLQLPISYRPHCISAWDGWSKAFRALY